RTAEYAAAENIPILMEIPDKRKIAEAYSNGILMVEALPEMKEKFQALYQNVRERITEAE
ncbi:MAG: hypothetical protein ACLFRF_07215, partial [Desulfobacterales bacterium]